jgi:hypothetical protein
MAQDYDNMGKNLWTDHADDLSKFVLDVDDVEVLEHLDTEQQTVIARHTDITKRVRINKHEAILHVELQLRESTDKPMWARNAQYQGYLVGKYQMPVYSNVIYFHPNAGRMDPGGYAYKRNGYENVNRYKVIQLSKIDGQAILEMQAPGLLPFTPLMKPPAGMDLERWLQQCVDATRSAPVDQRTQAELFYGIYLFGGVVYNSELLERLVSEGLMQESKTYQLLSEKFTRKTTIENTLALLERRFAVDAVRALIPALQSVTDSQKLQQLLLEAAEVKSIEAFAQMLNE